MKNQLKKSITLAAAFVACAVTLFLTTSATIMGTGPDYKPPMTGTKLDQYTSHPKRRLVIVTKQGTIKLVLFEKAAPNHVANIIKLADSHFYDGTYFHRVIPGFMIQGGDPNTKDDDLSNDGQGNNGSVRLMAELNDIHHQRGILSMARTQDVNSASCQFFICVADNAQVGNLDKSGPYGGYTAFGQVVEGIDVVDKIVNLPNVGKPGGTNPGKAAGVIKMYVENE
jgi:cyclophilin family peptidyl-prolyl cis-trans isomerase